MSIPGLTWKMVAGIAAKAQTRFHATCPAPVRRHWLDEEVGEGFHLSVECRADALKEKWAEAIDALASAVNAKRGRIVLEPLDLPPAVEVAFGEIPRLIVAYVPPTVDEAGRWIDGYLAGRFDVAGIVYADA